MISVSLWGPLAVIVSSSWTHALPPHPRSDLDPLGDFFQTLVSDGEDEGEQKDANNPFLLMMQRNGERESWNKGEKESTVQDDPGSMVEQLKDVMVKLAAADKLRSQGFLRSETRLPKTNKRACFWKYCVTN